MWVDNSKVRQPGELVFLILIKKQGQFGTRVRTSGRPGRTNMSHKALMRGWLGETDNVNVYACGVARVSRVSENGRRALVKQLRDNSPEAIKFFEVNS